MSARRSLAVLGAAALWCAVGILAGCSLHGARGPAVVLAALVLGGAATYAVSAPGAPEVRP